MFARARVLVLAAQLIAVPSSTVRSMPATSVSSLLHCSSGGGVYGTSSLTSASAQLNDCSSSVRSLSTNTMAAATAAASEAKASGSDGVGRRLVLVSGSTGGIGREIALGAAKQPNVTLLLPVRDVKRGAQVAAELKAESHNDHIHVLHVDLGSRASIISLANEVHEKYGRLDVLVNNAALAPPTREISIGSSDRKDVGGTQIETQFAVNVQSYWLMMNRFRPLLAKAEPAGTGRIVNVASNYAGDLDITDPQFVRRRYDPTSAYRASTQARRMITHEAAAQFAGDHIIANSCHPGVVNTTLLTRLGMNMGWNTAAEAAVTPLHLAFAPSVAGVTGKFWDNSKEKADPFIRDDDLVKKLWAYCKSLAFVDDIPATGATTTPAAAPAKATA